MIKSIDKNSYTDELVQYAPNIVGHDYILMDDKEILFLKSKGEVLINKYIDNPDKSNFTFQQIKYSRPFYIEWNSERYNEIFNYNKPYLMFEISNDGYRFGEYYFLKDGDGAFFIKESLPSEVETIELDFNRKELEQFFDCNNYDAMYIINREGHIKFASNKKDGEVISGNIIPNEDEIVDLEYDNSIRKETLYNMFRVVENSDNKQIKPKKIDDITNFPIYSKGMFHGYYNLLITINDGKFNVNWMGLDFVEKDKYRLTLGNVPIIEPYIEYIDEYKQEHDILPLFSSTTDSNINKVKKIK